MRITLSSQLEEMIRQAFQLRLDGAHALSPYCSLLGLPLDPP
jgi:hypothetical protein